mmetsp:Transcript_17344/g.56765  ORF Transcript_17344/g.56765 Transcript_17344/m.56765 type:complete len:549 (-) Transcript_17344:722-2368(-)
MCVDRSCSPTQRLASAAAGPTVGCSPRSMASCAACETRCTIGASSTCASASVSTCSRNASPSKKQSSVAPRPAWARMPNSPTSDSATRTTKASFARRRATGSRGQRAEPSSVTIASSVSTHAGTTVERSAASCFSGTLSLPRSGCGRGGKAAIPRNDSEIGCTATILSGSDPSFFKRAASLSRAPMSATGPSPRRPSAGSRSESKRPVVDVMPLKRALCRDSTVSTMSDGSRCRFAGSMFHTTASAITPSLKRRSSARSPQKARKALANGLFLSPPVFGPISTSLKACCGSMTAPAVTSSFTILKSPAKGFFFAALAVTGRRRSARTKRMRSVSPVARAASASRSAAVHHGTSACASPSSDVHGVYVMHRWMSARHPSKSHCDRNARSKASRAPARRHARVCAASSRKSLKEAGDIPEARLVRPSGESTTAANAARHAPASAELGVAWSTSPQKKPRSNAFGSASAESAALKSASGAIVLRILPVRNRCVTRTATACPLRLSGPKSPRRWNQILTRKMATRSPENEAHAFWTKRAEPKTEASRSTLLL